MNCQKMYFTGRRKNVDLFFHSAQMYKSCRVITYLCCKGKFFDVLKFYSHQTQ